MRSVLVAVVSGLVMFGAGWITKDFVDGGRSKSQAIYATWVTQASAISEQDGRVRTQAELETASRTMFATQSLALALHFNDLSKEERGRVLAILDRFDGEEWQTDGRLAPLDCIKKAGVDGAVNEECIGQSVKEGGLKNQVQRVI